MANNIGPYRRLQQTVVAWAKLVMHPRRMTMYSFNEKNLRECWNLQGIAERVAAADTLGWDTHLTFKDGVLKVVYVQRPGDAPHEIYP